MLNRRTFLQASGLAGCGVLAGCGGQMGRLWGKEGGGPYLGNGVKVGEIRPGSARVWVRLTDRAEADMAAPKFARESVREPTTVRLPEGVGINGMEGAIGGMAGQVRIAAMDGEGHEGATEWRAVDPERDYTVQVELEGLRAGQEYRYRVEARRMAGGGVTATVRGRFRTAPREDKAAEVSCVTTGDHEWWDRESKDGHKVYRTMRKMEPDFCIHSGDFVYYDKPGPIAKSVALARHKWNRMCGLPAVRAFYGSVGSYFQRDDHDTYCDDCYPAIEKELMGEFTFAEGIATHYEQQPLRPGEPYRTVRWGKDLQIWLVEGREFRTPDPRAVGEEERTIWGAKQIAWFKETVAASDATFKVLFTPSPMVGPDRDAKKDSYANAYYGVEGAKLRRFLAEQGMFTVNGDRHWQYVSVDPETGLVEYGRGPACDEHAGGWKQEDVRPEHRFLRVKGGFLGMRVKREGGKAVLAFTHYDVEGKVVHEERHERAV